MIKVITTLNEFEKYRLNVGHQSIGLVPTMGNLHEGHISLVAKSLSQNDLTMATIFVNPKQFGPNEDFDKYPRTIESDIEKLEEELKLHSNKELVVFAPKSADDIYPDDFSTTISLGTFTNKLCGKSRPGHFDGVTTVVYRLFAIAKAANAYFGQKDYQQFLTIKKMVDDLSYPIKLNLVDIKRDNSGLALSSRNQYLSSDEKEQALTLNKTLRRIEKELILNPWVKALEEINDVQENIINDNSWEYLEILDADTLNDVEARTSKVVVLGAYKLGKTRLIDNLLIDITYA